MISKKIKITDFYKYKNFKIHTEKLKGYTNIFSIIYINTNTDKIKSFNIMINEKNKNKRERIILDEIEKREKQKTS